MRNDPTKPMLTVHSLAELTTRRDFLRLMGFGGALVLLPGVCTACQDAENTGGITAPGSGNRITIDFSTGDVAILQFLYVIEQLQADFYTQVVSNFTGSDISPAEQTILSDMRSHEVVHRDFLKARLAANATFSLTPLYSVNLTNRAAVLDTATKLEDLGVAAYNGAVQYLSDANNLLAALKIVSVEARHSSVIRDLVSPRSGTFAPANFDNAFKPATVLTGTQPFIVDRLSAANAPSAFVQGPNANG